MSKNVKLNKAIFGVMRDNHIRNPDIFKLENATSPSRRFYTEKFRWWFRRLGFEDWHVPIFLILPFGIIAFWQATSFYLFYGEKPVFSKHHMYKDYHATPFLYSAKTNPDSHYSNTYSMYTNDKIYGLMALPKRPWEKFKDPENTIKRVAVRHNRDNPDF